MSGPNVKYKCEVMHGEDRIIKDGHTMFWGDVVQDLKRLTYLEGRVLILEERERKCETMDKSEKHALVRGYQEICDALEIDRLKSSPADIVKAVKSIGGTRAQCKQ